jgi:hypothetical protein
LPASVELVDDLGVVSYDRAGRVQLCVRSTVTAEQ